MRGCHCHGGGRCLATLVSNGCWGWWAGVVALRVGGVGLLGVLRSHLGHGRHRLGSSGARRGGNSRGLCRAWGWGGGCARAHVRGAVPGQKLHALRALPYGCCFAELVGVIAPQDMGVNMRNVLNKRTRIAHHHATFINLTDSDVLRTQHNSGRVGTNLAGGSGCAGGRGDHGGGGRTGGLRRARRGARRGVGRGGRGVLGGQDRGVLGRMRRIGPVGGRIRRGGLRDGGPLGDGVVVGRVGAVLRGRRRRAGGGGSLHPADTRRRR